MIERGARLGDIDAVAMRLPQVDRSTSDGGRHSYAVAGLARAPRRLAKEWLAERGVRG